MRAREIGKERERERKRETEREREKEREKSERRWGAIRGIGCSDEDPESILTHLKMKIVRH